MLRPYVRRPKRRVPNPSGHDGADAVRQGLGRARRPSAPGGPGAPVRGPASGARGDVAAGVRGVAAGGAPGAPTGADGGDGGSQRPHRRPRGADRRSDRRAAARSARGERAGLRAGAVRPPVAPAGNRARDRPRAGPHPAGHGDRVRRLAHGYARRLRGARPGDRHQRGRARARDPVPRVVEARDHGATGYVIEYTGEAIRALSMEERMTVCNMSIEAGARAGMIAPDETTVAYLAGRPRAPSGAAWDRAVAKWRELRTDRGATYDKQVELDASEVAPQVTWGTSPGMVTPVTGCVPSPSDFTTDAERRAVTRALEYMGLAPGTPLEGLPIDRVFLGSCTNARIEDLRAAARTVRGRHVATGVRAM